MSKPRPEAEAHEGSLLGRLFQRNRQPSAEARRAREFEDMLQESLEESVEDRELRRRLALGEGGRVA